MQEKEADIENLNTITKLMRIEINNLNNLL